MPRQKRVCAWHPEKTGEQHDCDVALCKTVSLQKRERFTFAMLHLVHRTLVRGLVGTPAKKLGAVAESAAGEMIIANFHDHFGRDRFPFASAIPAPPARPSRRAPRKPRRSRQCSTFPRYPAAR